MADDWGTRTNETIARIDTIFAESQGRLIWDENTSGDISDDEILTHDGEILGYI